MRKVMSSSLLPSSYPGTVCLCGFWGFSMHFHRLKNLAILAVLGFIWGLLGQIIENSREIVPAAFHYLANIFSSSAAALMSFSGSG